MGTEQHHLTLRFIRETERDLDQALRTQFSALEEYELLIDMLEEAENSHQQVVDSTKGWRDKKLNGQASVHGKLEGHASQSF